MDALSQNRLKWKCRRGRLELDLVLQDFFEKHLGEKDVEPLNELLDLQDNDLWDIVSGRSDRYDAKFGGIVARLRADPTLSPRGSAQRGSVISTRRSPADPRETPMTTPG